VTYLHPGQSGPFDIRLSALESNIEDIKRLILQNNEPATNKSLKKMGSTGFEPVTFAM
jgi:hypothetical protein